VRSKTSHRSIAGTRTHHHFRVTITYSDFEKSVSGKVSNSREKAEKAAVRHKKSPLVKKVRIDKSIKYAI
jgi:hypothetical protein